MTTRLRVRRLGTARVRIEGASDGEAVMDWLSNRSDVAEATYRRRLAAVDVRLTEGTNGSFVRGLEDWIYTQTAPPPAPTLGVSVTHHLAGRARLRLAGASEDDVFRLSAWVEALPGVLRASASPAAFSLLVIFDPAVVSLVSITQAIEGSDPASWPELSRPAPASGWAATAGTAAVLAASMSGVIPGPALSVLVGLTAIPSVNRARHALLARRLSIDLLDVAAVSLSLATGAPTTGAFITFLLSVGDRILDQTSDSARTAISRLMNLDATFAWRIEGEKVVRIPAARVAVGDRIVIDPGGRAAADGVVVSGEASVDEKALTGESVARLRSVGDRVMAATVVVEGQIVVEVDRVGMDTTASKIVQILEGAGAKPMTLQRDTERVTDRMVLPTFGVAAAAGYLTGEMARATSVLITDFGTGVRLVVPTGALTAMALAARRGVLVKGAQYLERLSKADVVVFDKTGTLTVGEPAVLSVQPVGERTDREVLLFAAAVETRQAHPIAEAVRRHAAAMGVVPPEAELGTESTVVGMGVSAKVLGLEVHAGSERWMRTLGIDLEPCESMLARDRDRAAGALLVAIGGAVAGVISLADEPRPESAEVVRRLKAHGRRRVILLSGDAEAQVRGIGRLIDADDVGFSMLPEAKAAYVRALQKAGKIVAMVGDGINDAPALAVADVGISLKGGTDLALETADVVLLEGGLAKLPLAFEAGERAMRSVKLGLALVIVPNAVGAALGALGLINPAIAAAINNGSTVFAALVSVAPLLVPPRLAAHLRGLVTPAGTTAAARTIHRTSLLAAALGAVLSPIPLADELALIPVYAIMARRIGALHGLSARAIPWRPLVISAATGLVARGGLILTVSFVPGVAAVANAVSAAALTEILGHHAEAVCASPDDARPLETREVIEGLRARAAKAVGSS